MNSIDSRRPVAGKSSRKPFVRTPAVQAMLIQLSSFLVALALAQGMPLLTKTQMTVAMAVLLQGGIAAALSYWRRLAPWWLLIQLAFPAALAATFSLQLRPGIFLAAFVALLGLYWSTFRTQVPFYPSRPAAWRAVADLLPADRPVRFIDIGSGLGGLTLDLSRRRPDSTFVGIELAPVLWFASLLRARMRRSDAIFIRGDYGKLDFAAYDVIFAYLSPAAMPTLWQKASAEMRPGSLLLSYEFNIPGGEPDLSLHPGGGGAILYGWRM